MFRIGPLTLDSLRPAGSLSLPHLPAQKEQPLQYRIEGKGATTPQNMDTLSGEGSGAHGTVAQLG